MIVSVVELPLAMGKDSSGKGMFPFDFLKPQENSTAKFRELQPIEHEQGAFNLTKIFESLCQIILTGIGTQLLHEG